MTQLVRFAITRKIFTRISFFSLVRKIWWQQQPKYTEFTSARFESDFHKIFLEFLPQAIHFSLTATCLVQANERLDDDEDYLVDHSIVLYLVDKNGEFVDFFTQRAQIGDVVDKIEAHMKTYEAAALAAKNTSKHTA